MTALSLVRSVIIYQSDQLDFSFQYLLCNRLNKHSRIIRLHCILFLQWSSITSSVIAANLTLLVTGIAIAINDFKCLLLFVREYLYSRHINSWLSELLIVFAVSPFHFCTKFSSTSFFTSIL